MFHSKLLLLSVAVEGDCMGLRTVSHVCLAKNSGIAAFTLDSDVDMRLEMLTGRLEGINDETSSLPREI